MRRNWVIILITAICLAVSAGASGQKKIVRQVLRVDSMMLQRYRAAKIDTNYVTRPTTRFTLSARFNTAGAKLNTEGYNEGGHFRGRRRVPDRAQHVRGALRRVLLHQHRRQEAPGDREREVAHAPDLRHPAMKKGHARAEHI